VVVGPAYTDTRVVGHSFDSSDGESGAGISHGKGWILGVNTGGDQACGVGEAVHACVELAENDAAKM
jgi:hypothetical protein